MTWDKTLPGDTEKIRRLGQVIRPNWEAIEEGDDVGVSNMLQMRSVQLDNRTGLAANNDPITNSGTHYLYSKDDGAGTQEAYMKDSAGNVIQVTSAGAIGGPGVEFQAETGFTLNGSNFVWAYGRVPAGGGAITGGQGLGTATVKTIAGQANAYEITLTRTPSNANYMVWGCAITNSGLSNGRVIEYVDTSATTALFGVRMKRCNDGVTVATEPFFVAVIGGF